MGAQVIYLDECESCGEKAGIMMYTVPTNGRIRGETEAITTALWCNSCAEENKDLIISDEDLRHETNT
jgi:hypothetical protein